MDVAVALFLFPPAEVLKYAVNPFKSKSLPSDSDEIFIPYVNQVAYSIGLRTYLFTYHSIIHDSVQADTSSFTAIDSYSYLGRMFVSSLVVLQPMIVAPCQWVRLKPQTLPKTLPVTEDAGRTPL